MKLSVVPPRVDSTRVEAGKGQLSIVKKLCPYQAKDVRRAKPGEAARTKL